MKPSDLLRGEYIGVKDLRSRISHLMGSKKPWIVTERGKPRQVLIAFDKVIELVEILEEMRDHHLMRRIEKARKNYKRTGGIPLSRLGEDLHLTA